MSARDPYASEKAQRTASTAAALTAVYVAAKGAVLRQFAAGVVRDALPSLWRGRVEAVVAEQAKSTAGLLGATVVTDVGGVLEDFDPHRMDAYLDVFADEFAKAWDEATNRVLNMIDLAEPDLSGAAELVLDAMVEQAKTDAADIGQRAANFGLIEGGKAAGATTKTWHTGTNPRPSHAALNGVTLPIDDRFANGQRFPGSPAPPAEVAGCNCHMSIGRAS
jgi:hypothetical protein